MKAGIWLVCATAPVIVALVAPITARCQAAAVGRAAVAAGIDRTALWDGRKAVEFHSITQPRMVRARDARFLIDDEYVLGITGNGESRAYPTRFASWHHIINDKIGNAEHGGSSYVTVTYCIVCNSGMRFETPVVNNKPLTFDFYGLYNGVMAMYDNRTKSVWLQVSGRAIQGPLLDTTLKTGALLDTTWGKWKKLHPDTLVMAPDPQFRDAYDPKGSVMVRGYTSFPAAYFRKTVTHRDSRLPMFESVLAIALPSAEDGLAAESSRRLYRAYPMKTFKGVTSVVNDYVGSTPVGVFFDAATETLNAVSRMAAGRTLTLEVRNGPRGSRAYYDRETGTRWNLEGRAEEGPLAGTQLPRIDSHMSQWYGWVSYFPQTTIYGRDQATVQASLR
jgi:hypothetical protein